jgi:hypothetical protein
VEQHLLLVQMMVAFLVLPIQAVAVVVCMPIVVNTVEAVALVSLSFDIQSNKGY